MPMMPGDGPDDARVRRRVQVGVRGRRELRLAPRVAAPVAADGLDGPVAVHLHHDRDVVGAAAAVVVEHHGVADVGRARERAVVLTVDVEAAGRGAQAVEVADARRAPDPPREVRAPVLRLAAVPRAARVEAAPAVGVGAARALADVRVRDGGDGRDAERLGLFGGGVVRRLRLDRAAGDGSKAKSDRDERGRRFGSTCRRH